MFHVVTSMVSHRRPSYLTSTNADGGGKVRATIRDLRNKS